MSKTTLLMKRLQTYRADSKDSEVDTPMVSEKVQLKALSVMSEKHTSGYNKPGIDVVFRRQEIFHGNSRI